MHVYSGSVVAAVHHGSSFCVIDAVRIIANGFEVLAGILEPGSVNRTWNAALDVATEAYASCSAPRPPLDGIQKPVLRKDYLFTCEKLYFILMGTSKYSFSISAGCESRILRCIRRPYFH